MLKFLLVVILFAVATYFLVRTLQERGLGDGSGGGSGGGGQRRPKTPRGPWKPPEIVPPDDDDDFLRNLDRERKKPKDTDS